LPGWHREEAGLCAQGPELSCLLVLLERRWEVRCPPLRNTIIRRRPTGTAMGMAQAMDQDGEHGMAARPDTPSRAATVRRIAVRSAAAIGPGTAARAATQCRAAFASPIAATEILAFSPAHRIGRQRHELTGRALHGLCICNIEPGFCRKQIRPSHAVPNSLSAKRVSKFFVGRFCFQKITHRRRWHSRPTNLAALRRTVPGSLASPPIVRIGFLGVP
jgi:hypothetical protein